MTTETVESAPEGTPPLYVNLSSGPSAAIGVLAGALFCLTFGLAWVYGQEYLSAWLAALLFALLGAMGYDYRRARALGMRRGDALVLALLGSVVYRLMLWLRARLVRQASTA